MRSKTTTNKSTVDVPAFSQKEVKHEGKVYTPDVVSTSIVERFSYFKNPNRSVCDPSSGQGNFLRVIFNRRLQQVQNPNDAFEQIWGFELDPKAVANAHQYFIEKGVSKSLVKRNILQGNTLEIYLEYIDQFDDVIGNPPYVRSFKSFPHHIDLRDNLADAFFQVGMDLLKPGDDCHLVYITQDSFITNEVSTLRRYLTQFNLVTVEHHFEYSKAFRRHDIAVDIGLIEVTKGKQQPTVNVSRHVPFKLSSKHFGDHKWLIYPNHIQKLAKKLLSFGVPLSSQCVIKKGRTANQTSGVPSSYGNTTFKKIKDEIFNVPVLAEPNTDFYFPNNKELCVYGKAVNRRDNKPFAPFIVLPYFTSKFRFCLIEQDLLTTPLLYVLSGINAKALVPLLNSSVVDFIIRYTTKSRDTGYEFKSSTFDNIRVPNLDQTLRTKLETILEFVRTGEITKDECDHFICTEIYQLNEEELALIEECKLFWFKKNVKKVTNEKGLSNLYGLSGDI